MRFLTIGDNDDNQRLDRFLGKLLPRASKGWIQKMIRTKRIKVNRKRSDSSAMLKSGDEIALYIYDEVLASFEEKPFTNPSRFIPDIVYENDDFAVIDKPKGILTHAAKKKDYGKNVVDGFIYLLRERGTYIPGKELSFKPAVVNRLDFNTAGLIIGAKNHDALVALNRGMSERGIRKYYRACVEGLIDKNMEITLPLLKQGNRAIVSEEGKEALTRVFPVSSYRDFSVVDILLDTGRYHQIRAHLSALGYPLIGDSHYGAKRRKGAQLLIAYKLEFADLPGLEYTKNLSVISKRMDLFMEDIEQLKRERSIS